VEFLTSTNFYCPYYWPFLTGRISTDGFILAYSPGYPAMHGRLFPTDPFIGLTGEVAENSSWSIASSSVDELPRFSGASRPIPIDQREALLQRSVFIAA